MASVHQMDTPIKNELRINVGLSSREFHVFSNASGIGSLR